MNFEYFVRQRKEKVEASVLHLEANTNTKHTCLPYPTTSIATTDVFNNSLEYFEHFTYNPENEVRPLEEKALISLHLSKILPSILVH